MASGLKTAVRRIRKLAGLAETAQRSDCQLLERFARTGDETAFTALVHRHGALVLGVCRRVLGNDHDAEDAFQATFLVLARKAGSQVWQESIGNWLHGVAYRIAMKARTARLRRRIHECRASEESPPTSSMENVWQDLRRVLDEELSRLPAKYRTPLILCYLEGRTRDEAAEELGWSTGSIKGRLERGREMLRQRLSRRGLTLSAVLCAGLLAESSASAAVSTVLATATIQAARQFAAGALVEAAVSSQVISLAQGVLYTMMLAKIKMTALAIGFVGLLGLGAGLVSQQAMGEIPAPAFGLAALQPSVGELQPVAFTDEKDGEKRDRPKEGVGARGTIKKLDLDKGTITLFRRADGGDIEKTYSLASKDIKVTIALGGTGKLADLKEGMNVLVQLSAVEDVSAIHVELPSMLGFLSSVDVAKNTISLKGTRDDGSGGKTLKVSPEARLVINGKASKLEDFAGEERRVQRVQLTLSIDGATVLAMLAGRVERDGERKEGAPKEREGEGRGRPMIGVILEIDAAKKTIDVLTGGEESPKRTVYAIADGVKISLRMEPNLQEVPLKELSPPLRGVLFLAPDGKTVAHIDLVPPTQRILIKSVDAAKNKLVIGIGEGGGEKTLDLAADVKVFMPGREGAFGKLSDLAANTQAVLVLSLDRARVLSIRVFVGER